MFKTDKDQNRVARALCASLPRLKDMWTEDGPTDEAWDLAENDGGTLSSGERIVLLFAFGIAAPGAGEASPSVRAYSDLLRLDNTRLFAFGTLLRALAENDLDEWLADFDL